jgi:hypothetical protein
LARPVIKENLRPAALALAGYLGAVLVLHPFADLFYGGDDWAYAWSVKTLVEQGKLRASSWVSAAAVPQTFWAAGFARVMGSHPRTMNLASLCLSFFGIVALYALARRMRVRAADAAWVAAFVGVGPFYLAFASSFMSDIYYAVFLTCSLLGYVSAIRTRSAWWALAGGVMAGLGFLNRQIGICLPASFGVTMAIGVLLRRDLLRDGIRLLVAGCTPPAVAFATYTLFPDWLGGRTVAQQLTTDPNVVGPRLRDYATTVSSLNLTLLYAVILVLPLFAVLALRSREQLASALRYRLVIGVAGVLSVGAFAYRAIGGSSFEVRGEFVHTARYGAAPLRFAHDTWWLLSLLASLAFPLLCAILFERIGSAIKALRKGGKSEKSDAAPPAEEADAALPLVLLLLCLAFHVALTSSFVTFYNNYFLPLDVMTTVLVAGMMRPKEARPGAAAVALFAISAAASLVALDSHYRYVEANERAVQALLAGGADSREVFGYPSSFAWANYDLVSRYIEKTRSFNVFGHYRRQSRFLVLNPSMKPPNKHWKRVQTEEYGTLLGKEELAVWTCGSKC